MQSAKLFILLLSRGKWSIRSFSIGRIGGKCVSVSDCSFHRYNQFRRLYNSSSLFGKFRKHIERANFLQFILHLFTLNVRVSRPVPLACHFWFRFQNCRFDYFMYAFRLCVSIDVDQTQRKTKVPNSIHYLNIILYIYVEFTCAMVANLSNRQHSHALCIVWRQLIEFPKTFSKHPTIESMLTGECVFLSLLEEMSSWIVSFFFCTQSNQLCSKHMVLAIFCSHFKMQITYWWNLPK